MARYDVFIRRSWRKNPGWPQGKEPHWGRKTYLARGVSFAIARQMCKEYNDTHKPGKYSLMAEFAEA